jgi:hypothetical protein
VPKKTPICSSNYNNIKAEQQLTTQVSIPPAIAPADMATTGFRLFWGMLRRDSSTQVQFGKAKRINFAQTVAM